ncbi:MAG: hypothetical protein ABSF29_15105 [Tepidisphaeraceae bacterium]|jgi:hypothetical protein
MPLKRTYFHRNYAIAHRVFGSEATEETLHQFCVSRAGETNHLFVKASLDEAKMAIDQLIEGGGHAALRPGPLTPARA